MALIHSGYFNGVDAAEPILPPDRYNSGYQLAFEYDTYLEGSSGNTVLRIVRVYLFSNLLWYPINLLGTATYTGDVASLGIGFNTSSVTRQTTSGATGKYWAYDADQNEVSDYNPGGGPNEAVTFAYDEIDYPVVYKPHAPTTVLSAGASDRVYNVNVYIEIRDGEIGYLYKGNKAISVSVPRNQWIVKLHPNGGVVDGSSAATVTKTKYYNQTLTIPTPTKTNAVFRGWYTNERGAGDPVSASYTQNADLELWAIWYEPYPVVYDGNPASEATNVPALQWKVYDQSLTLSAQKPVRSGGYVFKEWNTQRDGSGTPYAPGASYSANAPLTLYAIWYPPYYITYSGNDGSDTASTVSNVPWAQIKSHGVALTLTSQKPTRPGYLFANWNTNASGTGVSYNPGSTYPASNNADQRLYAIWTPTVDSKAITVNKSIRTGSISSETEADEGGYAFIDFSYSFVGAASGTVSVSVGRTPEGGTRTAVPAARISGDTAKSKSVGYATLSGNVKVHDDGGGSLPITTRYKYDITVTFAGTSATGASYIEKAFFTISVLGDGVSGQTPGHGIAFGMPATRAAFDVGPSMPGHFWAALYAHQNLLVGGNASVGGEVTAHDSNNIAHNLTEKLSLSGGTMTGALHVSNAGKLIYDYTGSAETAMFVLKGAENYGIRYKEGDPDTLKISASGNANTDSGADLCINGNGNGTVTIRGNTIAHAGNVGTGDSNGQVKIAGINVSVNGFNFDGTTFYSGYRSGAEHDADNAVKNGHYYYTSNGPATSLGASTTDGALYVQQYNDLWVAQIAQDYRNGGLFVRGKNNGTWQSWQKVYDTAHKPTLSELGAAASSHSHSHITNTFAVTPTGGNSYNEGIRINRVSSGGWSLLMIGTNPNSTSGSGDYQWLIGTPPTSEGRQLRICHNGSGAGTYFFSEGTNGAVGLHVHGKMQFRTVIYNSGGSNNSFTLTQSIANFNHARIYYFTTSGGGQYFSVDVCPATAMYVDLHTGVAQQGSPNKYWADHCSVYLSGTGGYMRNYYGQFWSNSSSSGVSGDQKIHVYRVEAWNE